MSKRSFCVFISGIGMIHWEVSSDCDPNTIAFFSPTDLRYELRGMPGRYCAARISPESAALLKQIDVCKFKEER